MTIDPNIVRLPNTPCQHCGLIHTTPCPWVKAYEYHPDGSLKRVEFHSPVPVTFPALFGPLWPLGLNT